MNKNTMNKNQAYILLFVSFTMGFLGFIGCFLYIFNVKIQAGTLVQLAISPVGTMVFLTLFIIGLFTAYKMSSLKLAFWQIGALIVAIVPYIGIETKTESIDSRIKNLEAGYEKFEKGYSQYKRDVSLSNSYILETESFDGETIAAPVDMNVFNELCGDKDGCIAYILFIDDDGNFAADNPQSHNLILYESNSKKWRAYNGTRDVQIDRTTFANGIHSQFSFGEDGDGQGIRMINFHGTCMLYDGDINASDEEEGLSFIITNEPDTFYQSSYPGHPYPTPGLVYATKNAKCRLVIRD